MPKLSVLMPVFNEVRTLAAIVDRVLSAPIDLKIELIMVDDGSKDGSADIMDRFAAKDPRVIAIHQDRNRGKGAAIARAIKAATGDFGIIQDADLEYDPADYPAILRPLLDGLADVVYGSRFASPNRHIHSLRHQIANQVLTTTSNILNDMNLTDMETCYKAFRMDLLKMIPLESQRFGIEPELTAKVARIGARLYEVPIQYHGRSVWAGKKITWKDGVSALWVMLKCRFGENYLDHDGFRALKTMSRADRIVRSLVGSIRPYLGKRILEVGSGIGTLSRHLVSAERLVLADVDPFYVRFVRDRFGHFSNVSVVSLDPADPSGYRGLESERLDTVVSTGSIEYAGDDLGILRSFRDVVSPGGRAIVVAPQCPWLYGEIDRAMGRIRRYSSSDLSEKMESAGFEIEHVFDVNEAATLPWHLSGRVLRRRRVSDLELAVIDRLHPLASSAEKWLPWPGLSVVAVGRRRS